MTTDWKTPQKTPVDVTIVNTPGAPVPVVIPTPVPVTGPLTDAELRASPVSVTATDKDNTVLFTGSIAVTGPGAAIEVTGYQGISAQLTGVWAGSLIFESSNDGTNWDIVLIMSRDDVALQDKIDQNGLYSVRSSGKYLRYNIIEITGSVSAVILGKTVEALSPADKLSLAMDPALNMPLNTLQSNVEKRDVNNAAVPSDAPAPIIWTSPLAAYPIIIDTTGYQTVIVQKITAGVVTPNVSNDRANWVATTAVNDASATAKAATIPTAAGVYAIPVTARYLRLTGPATLVTCIIYLRQQPLDMTSLMLVPPFNVAQVGGTTVVTANVSGMLAVGGNIAPGVAPTAFPIPLAADYGTKQSPTAKTRRLLTDDQGRLVPSNMDYYSWITQQQFSSYGSQNVRDSSTSDGRTFMDLLLEILIELKILNLQMHELPLEMTSKSPSGIDIETIRAEI